MPLHLNLASGRISKVIYREVPVLSGAQLTDKAFPGSGTLLCADAKLYKMPGSCIPEESYLYCIAIFSRRREIFEGAKQQLLEMIRQIHPTLQSCLCFPWLHGQDKPFQSESFYEYNTATSSFCYKKGEKIGLQSDLQPPSHPQFVSDTRSAL